MPEARDGDRREDQVSTNPETDQEIPMEEQRNEASNAEAEPGPTPRIQFVNQRPSTSQEDSLDAALEFIQRLQARYHQDARRHLDQDDFLPFEDEMRFPNEWHEIHKRSMVRLKQLYEKMLDHEEGEVDR